MKIILNIKILVEYEGKFLTLAKYNLDGSVEYDLPSGELEMGADIIKAAARVLNRTASIKCNKFTFLTENKSTMLEGGNVITLYYHCEIEKDEIILSKDYDAYYWHYINGAMNSDLPIWIKAAALMLNGLKKTQKHILQAQAEYLQEVCEGLGGVKNIRQSDGAIQYKKGKTTFCEIFDTFFMTRSNEQYAVPLAKYNKDITMISKKTAIWIKVKFNSSVTTEEMADFVTAGFELA